MTTSGATVIDRLIDAGITKDRALGHLKSRSVRVDGAVVTDPSIEASPPAQIELLFGVRYTGDQE